MTVAYIGDREVGKTHLALELANPQSNHVKVIYPEYSILKTLLYNESQERTVATNDLLKIRKLQIQVDLPFGQRDLDIDWMDSSGESWRESWKMQNPEKWQIFLETLRQSKGIILVLSPYRELVTKGNQEDFITQVQWNKRFIKWVYFFRYQCPKLSHLLLCLNKADLFCDVEQEANILRYSPNGSQLNWYQRNDYVFRRYFTSIKEQVLELSQKTEIDSIRYFITSIRNRDLIELPWIYLGTHLK